MPKIFSAVLDAIRAHPKAMPLNDRGQLVPDPTPMAPPIGYKPQPSMVDLIRKEVLRVSQEARRAGFESEEEADDFEVGDDFTPSSPYELDEESEVPIRVLKARADQAQLDYLEAKRGAGLRMQEDAGAGGAGAGKAPAAKPAGAAPSPERGRGEAGEPAGERS